MAKFACYSRCLLASYFYIPVPYNEKDIFFGVLVLEGLVGLHRTVQLQLLQHYWSGHRLGLPFRFDLNQIPYDYTMEVRNRFERLNLIECLENYAQSFVILYRRQG